MHVSYVVNKAWVLLGYYRGTIGTHGRCHTWHSATKIAIVQEKNFIMKAAVEYFTDPLDVGELECESHLVRLHLCESWLLVEGEVQASTN